MRVFYFVYNASMLFRFLKIRKMIQEARQDPGKLAGDETKDMILGILILPAIGIFLWLALMFILGFTTLLGGPMGFFKFVFIVSVVGTVVLVSIVRKLLALVHRGARYAVGKTIETGKGVRDAVFTVQSDSSEPEK